MEERDLRSVAAEMGIGAATLMRIEHGREVDSATTIKLLVWLFEPRPAVRVKWPTKREIGKGRAR
jgi:transcriptional regulator with XRE-family HTH domain